MDVNLTDEIMRTNAISGVYAIVIMLICIGFSWWALQSLRFDVFLRNHKGPQAKLLQILLSLVLGYETARFILDYFHWSTLLKGLI